MIFGTVILNLTILHIALSSFDSQVSASLGNIEECGLNHYSVTETQDYQCKEQPTVEITSSEDSLLEDATFDITSKFWQLSLETPIKLDLSGKCPIELNDVICDDIEISVGSKFGNKDGSRVKISTEQQFGDVVWRCTATDENDIKVNVLIVFFISGTTNEAETDINDAMAEFLKNTLWNAPSKYSTGKETFELLMLQKFDKINAETGVFYTQATDTVAKEEEKVFIFLSDEAQIKLAEKQYTTMMTSGSPSDDSGGGQSTPFMDCDNYYKYTTMMTSGSPSDDSGGGQSTPFMDCDNYYKLKFPEIPAEDSASTPSPSNAQLLMGPMMLMYYVWKML